MSPGDADERSTGATTNDTDLLFVLGTRPEIIKIAPILHACDRRDLSTTVVHTGQHYSDSLDDVFFEQLGLDPPAVNLGVGSGTHAEQTAAMLEGVERRIRADEPDIVVVQGDTNSTLAGALAGSKLDVDVAHVEAGLRSFDDEMPEETNRILVDHVADYLFPPTAEAARLLRDEGISPDLVTVTGNTIVDAVHYCSSVASTETDILDDLGVEDEDFYLMTAHRAENVDSRSRFVDILDGINRIASHQGAEIVYPIHPRAQKRLDEFDIELPANITTVDPLGFLEFLRLEDEATLVFTDSGGVQEETCILGTPCVTVRYGTERPETAQVGSNCVAGTRPEDIVNAGQVMLETDTAWETPFGDGNAAESILDELGYERADHPDGVDARTGSDGTDSFGPVSGSNPER